MQRGMAMVTLVVTTFLFSTLPASAQDGDPVSEVSPENEEARMHFVLGRRYYETGRFVEAAREFEAAFAISPLPALRFNIYLAHRDAGDEVMALEALRHYVETLDEGSDRALYDARLQVMEERLRGASVGEPVQTHEADGGESDGFGEVTSDQGASSQGGSAGDDDGNGGGPGIAPWIVVGAGGALVLGAVVTGVLAAGEASTLDDMCPTRDACEPGFEDARSRGEALALTTDILWITGALAVAGGLVWAFLAGGDEDAASTRAGFACDTYGCLATVRGEL